MNSKNQLSPQLSLGLPLREDATFASFIDDGNIQLLLNLKQMSKREGEDFLYMHGKIGTGKSHLLQGTCLLANEIGIRSIYVPLKELPKDDSSIFENLETFDLVCIDDIDEIVGLNNWEEAIFNFFNRIHETSNRLIIGAKTIPNKLGLKLYDLQSRLNLGLCFKVHELPEQAMLKALNKQCEQVGLEFGEDVAQFLMRRIKRNMAAIMSAFAKLDEASLIEQRKLTIPFVKKVLGI